MLVFRGGLALKSWRGLGSIVDSGFGLEDDRGVGDGSGCGETAKRVSLDSSGGVPNGRKSTPRSWVVLACWASRDRA